jgi:hypothetical protein
MTRAHARLAALRFYRESESDRVASDFELELRRCIELVLRVLRLRHELAARGLAPSFSVVSRTPSFTPSNLT